MEGRRVAAEITRLSPIADREPGAALPQDDVKLELWALDVAHKRIARMDASLEVNATAKSAIVK